MSAVVYETGIVSIVSNTKGFCYDTRRSLYKLRHQRTVLFTVWGQTRCACCAQGRGGILFERSARCLRPHSHVPVNTAMLDKVCLFAAMRVYCAVRVCKSSRVEDTPNCADLQNLSGYLQKETTHRATPARRKLQRNTGARNEAREREKVNK